MTDYLIANYVQVTDAEYKQQELLMFQNNPLIEALPPVMSVGEYFDLIEHYPPYSPKQRESDTETRLLAINKLRQFFSPLSIHHQLSRNLSHLIRMGYVNRNPANVKFWQQVNDPVEAVEQSLLKPNRQSIRNNSLAMGFTGYSGMGKSTALRETLSLSYPQVIRHNAYKGIPFAHLQVTWMMIDCPSDGERKQICHRILKNFDDLLGTSYLDHYGEHGRASVSSLITSIARLAQAHGLGMLVIDEIQRLNSAKRGWAERMCKP